MKRLLTILLSLAMLCACVPTPEQEFIVNKGDSTVEDKLNAAVAEGEDGGRLRQRYPERWDAEPIEVGKNFTIHPEAEIITKADGIYPVYKIVNKQFSEEQTAALLEALFGKPVSVSPFEMTKEDYGRQLQQFLDDVEAYRQWVAAGKPNDGIERDETGITDAYIENMTATIMENLKNAPDALEPTPIHDYSDLEMLYRRRLYTLSDGTKGWVYASPTCIEASRTDGQGYPFARNDYELVQKDNEPVMAGYAARWKDAEISCEEAERILEKELKRLDLADFSVRVAREANLYAQNADGSLMKAETCGWLFTLCRNPGGYPMPADVFYEPSQNLQYGTGDAFIANTPISPEKLTVFIDEAGARYLKYESPKEITGIINANVELLSWEDVQNCAIKSLTMCTPTEPLRKARPDLLIPLNIYKMLLTTYHVRQKNGTEIYMMPCWFVYYDGLYDGQYTGEWAEKAREEELRERADPDGWHECLILNAVDGSVIHSDWGY